MSSLLHPSAAIAESGTLHGAVPLRFGPSETRCFGWLHRARAPERHAGIVLCSPIGYEGNCAYETFTQLAERLADAGFDVLRFDPHGTGDSEGTDFDPNRIEAWQRSTRAALEEIRRLTGIAHVSAFGVRLGATLAAYAAAEVGGIDSLVLWAPCASGRSFARELRAGAAGPSEDAAPSAHVPASAIEALGYVYTEQTLKDMASLDLLRLPALPAKRALLIARDDMPSEGPLPSAWRKSGVDTQFIVLPGYRSMMTEPHASDVSHGTLDAIVAWFSEVHPLPARGHAGLGMAAEPASSDIAFDGVRETALSFGPQQHLFGILAEPLEPAPATDMRARRAILLINVGNNHRIGPNRLYVTMARAWARRGERVFRFDLSGIGDSRAGASASPARLYRKESVHEVQQAMDFLEAKGCKEFIVLGVCSGAYVAFQTSLVDPRVVGQVLLNPRRLDWKEGDTLQTVMSQSYKSTYFYRQALWEPSTYRRLLRREIDVRGIGGRVKTLLSAHLKRAARRGLRMAPAEGDVLANVRLVSQRGVDTLFIIANEDDCLDYIEFHLGSRGQSMRGYANCRMHFVAGGDHTFSRVAGQTEIIDFIAKHFTRRIRG